MSGVNPTVRTQQQLYDAIGNELYTTPNADVISDIVASIPSLGGGGGNGADEQMVEMQLSHAQILALNETPITLIPAPGAEFIVAPTYALAVADTVGGAYVNGTAKLMWDGAGNELVNLDDILQAEGVSNSRGPINTHGFDAAQEGIVNAAFVLANNSDAWEGGDPANTVSIRIYYRILPVVPFGGA